MQHSIEVSDSSTVRPKMLQLTMIEGRISGKAESQQSVEVRDSPAACPLMLSKTETGS